MPIDASKAIGTELPEQQFSWGPSDVVRYHLAIGAGAKPTDSREVRYFVERELRVLPTFAVTSPVTFGVAGPSFYHPEPPEIRHAGLSLSLTSLLQSHLDLTIHRPLPTQAETRALSRITDIHDVGRNAVLVQEAELVDSDGPLCSVVSSIHVRGEGGFGGSRPSPGSSYRVTMPQAEPDLVLDVPTLPQQALLYQLCGDSNPVHSDPDYARKAGFPQPILQGACTYGLVAKAIVDAVYAGEVARVARCATRFAGVVYPGETIRVQVWRRDGGVVFLASTAQRPDTPVLTDGLLTMS